MRPVGRPDESPSPFMNLHSAIWEDCILQDGEAEGVAGLAYVCSQPTRNPLALAYVRVYIYTYIGDAIGHR